MSDSHPPRLTILAGPLLSPSSPPLIHDCIIIGAGISGLAAGCYLRDHHCSSFIVLEARSRVGGRTFTQHTTDGHWVDVGGAYVGPTQNRVLRLAHSLGVKTEPVYAQGKSVLSVSGRRVEYSGVVPRLGALSLLDVNAALRATEHERKKIDPARPWLQQSGGLDSLTAEEWLQRVCDTEEGREMYRGVVRGLLCVEPCEVSALYWLWYVQSGEGVDVITGLQGGAQEAHFSGGSQQLSERMRQKVGADRVITGKPVDSIDWDESRTAAGVTEAQDIAAGVNTRSLSVSASSPPVRVRCRDGSCFYSRRVIVAVSPALYDSIRFQPYLPSWKQQPTARMHMGSVIKTVMRYERPWWREAGYCGILFYMPHPASSSSSSSPSAPPPPIGYSYDDCHEEAAEDGTVFYAIMGFMFTSAFAYYQPMSVTQRQAAIARQYRDAFQSELALNPLSYTECDWTAEEFSRGCYTAVMPPLVMSSAQDALRTPTAGIHYAGTETAVFWSGYMSGAVEAGERAAHEVLQALGGDKVKGDFVLEEGRGAGWTVGERIQESWLEATVRELLPSVQQLKTLGGLLCAAASAVAARWWLRRR